jgi:hypothetical protein
MIDILIGALVVAVWNGYLIYVMIKEKNNEEL